MLGPINRPGSPRARQVEQGSSPLHPLSKTLFAGRTGLWINGVEYTRYLIVDSSEIKNTGYPQTGTFRFRLEG